MTPVRRPFRALFIADTSHGFHSRPAYHPRLQPCDLPARDHARARHDALDQPFAARRPRHRAHDACRHQFGISIHTILVAFGISALIVASPTAFTLLKTGGAGYLLWLAIQAIRHGSNFVVRADGERQVSPAKAFLNGLWVNLLNPKVIIFFMTFLPQFVSASDPNVTGKLLFLGIWSIFLSLPIGLAIIFMADILSSWLQANRKVLRAIDYTFAGVFSIFAVKILFTQAR